MTTINSDISADVMDALKFIRAAKKNKNVKDITLTDNSRFNEQELYAALSCEKLEGIDAEAAKLFKDKFQKVLNRLEKDGKNNALYRAVRRLARKLKKKGLITKEERRDIKKYAAGMSQLDDDPNRVSEEKRAGSSETPVRTVKTIADKLKENSPLTEEERVSFNQTMRKEMGLAVKNKGEVEEEEIVIDGGEAEDTVPVEEEEIVIDGGEAEETVPVEEEEIVVNEGEVDGIDPIEEEEVVVVDDSDVSETEGTEEEVVVAEDDNIREEELIIEQQRLRLKRQMLKILSKTITTVLDSIISLTRVIGRRSHFGFAFFR